MTDHATRRNASIDATLTAIDTVTNPECHTCGTELSPRSPSDLFCDAYCQDRGLAAVAAKQVPAGWRAYDMDRDPDRYDRPRFRRLYLNNPVAAEAANDEPEVRLSFLAGESWEAVADRLHSSDATAPVGLSVTAATVRSMDAATAAIEATTMRITTRRAEIDHQFHRHEHRGGLLMWVLAAALLVVGALFAVDDTWAAAVFMWVVAAGSAWVGWVSVGNARAAVVACPICQPCDTTD